MSEDRNRFAVIGAGMSGILSGIKLTEAGHRFTIFEKADRVGGTWRENTYPGIACDVPSHIYSYSFDLNPDWSHFCSPGEEIRRYFEGAVDRFGIGDHIRFDDEVVSCVWHEDDLEWEVTTAAGHVERFDWVIAATGILHRPKLPDIDGLDTFTGPMFHTATWDHDIDLTGARVGMIGTGSSSVQVTGAIADQVERLSIFQRTAQWVVPVDQTAYTEEEKQTFRTDADVLQELHEHMSQAFNDNFATDIIDASSGIADQVDKLSIFQRTAQWVVPVEQTAYTEDQKQTFRTDADVLQELHEHMSQAFNDNFATDIIDASSGIADKFEEQCLEMLAQIEDPVLREKITPDYRAGCKRLIVSHNYYDAIVKPSVDVVTETIEAIEPTGVRTADGVLHEIDVLVLATGFHVDAFMRPMTVSGRDGVTLDEVWADWPKAYMAVAVPEFPNFFMLNGPNSPVGNFSLIQTAELQFAYAMSLVDEVHKGRLRYAVPTADAAARFEDERVEAAKSTVWATGCRSWYLDKNGVPFAWPFPFERFRMEMAEPRLGDFESV